jgi:diadenosine tetraphosphate (Ap4A) HIT family hydrolase
VVGHPATSGPLRQNEHVTPAERLAELAEGRNPSLIARLPSGFLIMGNYQFFPGYCLLLAYPMVGKLNDLEGEARAQFLADMARAGDAVLKATDCARINYSIYGNLDPFLHAHIWPRRADEDDAYRTQPPFLTPPEVREAPEYAYSPEKHGQLQERIRQVLG